jgi:hypothetical protein
MEPKELTDLLKRIHEAEDLVDRAEVFFAEKSREWSDGVVITFEKFLERKRDQIYFEQSLAEQMGWRIALEREPNDI